eukprot:8416339-Alexandrium_andersonii.AAC.1
MSASLVGSEMCIRDSPLEQREPSCFRPCLARCHVPAGSALRRTLGHSVSYTHLTLPTICSV